MILLIIVLVLVFGLGGGYFGYNRWGYRGGGGIGLGIIFVSMARRPLTGRAVEEHLNGQSNLEAESPSL